MSKRRRVADWFRAWSGYIVRLPNWPKRAEKWFKTRDEMIDWARAEGLTLRDANPRP